MSSSSTLPIQALILSPRTAPDALRARLAFSGDSLHQALKAARQNPQLGRLVIISTCERIELYTALPDTGPPNRQTLVDWLANWHGVEPELIAQHAEYRADIAAARHLLRVSTGLESSILGEAQIVSQVASAISASTSAHAASPVLKAVFKAAVKAGEMARGSVWANYNRTDIGAIAIDAALERLQMPAGETHAVVVGTGTVGRLALSALQQRQAGTVSICNRTIEHTTELVARCNTLGINAIGCELQALPALLRDADMVILATSAPSHVIDHAMTHSAFSQRTRPLVLVDAAMPHNADPAIRSLPTVTLLDLDDLDPYMQRARAERMAAVPSVESLIEHQLAPVAQRAWPVRSAIAPWSQPALSSAGT